MDKLIETLRLAKPETDVEDFLNARDLYGQGIVDSMDIIVIIDEINEAFGINITGDELRREDFKTVENIYKLIEQHGGV